MNRCKPNFNTIYDRYGPLWGWLSRVEEIVSISYVAWAQYTKSTKYLRVCLFCMGPISSETPCRTMAKFYTQTRTDHLGFMFKGVVVTKKMTYFKEIPACRPTVSQRWRIGRLGGWLQPRQAVAKACAINSFTINSTGSVRGRWLAGCMQGRHSDQASVSLSD